MGDEFLKKTGIIINNIAFDLLRFKKGERMPNISYYQKEFNVSRGTVQNALNFLKDKGAIVCESKGHMGTFITEINDFILHQYALSETILGTMTLPYSRLYEGLATGLYMEFEKNNLKLNMAYIRGSKERINSIINRTYRFGIVSRFAAKQVIETGEPIEIIMDFGDHSYLSEHILLFSKKNTCIMDGMRIGVDFDSLDQQFLTKLLVGKHKVQYVKVPGHGIIHALQSGSIDAGVWNFDEIRDKNIKNMSFARIEAKEALDLSASVIICHSDDLSIHTIFKDRINKTSVSEIQTDVVNGKLIPKY